MRPKLLIIIELSGLLFHKSVCISPAFLLTDRLWEICYHIVRRAFSRPERCPGKESCDKSGRIVLTCLRTESEEFCEQPLDGPNARYLCPQERS